MYINRYSKKIQHSLRLGKNRHKNNGVMPLNARQRPTGHNEIAGRGDVANLGFGLLKRNNSDGISLSPRVSPPVTDYILVCVNSFASLLQSLNIILL